ncbi:MAG: fibronectin type III domain-containing protein [Saprospiraceae bacterium]|nr:fibronectin type III domain-containing protein [Saprospiraceae bacterium]
MKQIVIYIVAIVMSLFVRQLTAQNTPPQYSEKIPVHLKLLTRNYGNKIVLRWAFSEPEAWRWVNTQGWVLERFELDGTTNKAISASLKPLTSTPIKPWAKEEWQSHLTARDSFGFIAAECLLGESKLPAAGIVRQMDLKVKDDANRFSFAMLAADLSVVAAEGLGLRFTDSDVNPNRKYVYRLHIPSEANSRFKSDTALAIINSNQVYEMPTPDAPEAVPGDSLVSLSWFKVKGFTAYHIERSADGGKTWKQLNQKPFLNMSSEAVGDPDRVFFTDRLAANYVKFQYRLRGITPFAEVTEASAAVESQGIDLTPTVEPRIRFAENTKGTTIELKWDCPMVADLSGFMVAKSGSVEGPWVDLTDKPLAPSVHAFTDTNGDEFGINFYRVYSIDDHNNRQGSYPAYVQMVNQAPPAAPNWKNIECRIDTTGKVTLTWLENTEPDLWGYQVYYANQADHDFLPITGEMLTDTTYSYMIPLNNLSEKMYFRVMAVDKNYALSPSSETLELHKPDKIAPVAPVFHDYSVTEKGIHLKWAKSSSDDAQTQTLMRRTVGQKEWEKIADLPKLTEGYLDEKVESQTAYEYWIYCTDDAGLQSPRLRTLIVQSMYIDVRSKIDNLQGKAKDSGIQLTWQYTPADAIYKVFRITGEAQLSQIGKIEKGQPLVFEDTKVERGKQYRYAIKAFHTNGQTSQLAQSEWVRMMP